MSDNSNNAVRFLSELRTRLIYSLFLLLSLFIVFIYFSKNLYSFLADPLLKFLPQGHLIATQVISPVFVPFKLAFWVAALLAWPFFLYQLWVFISPALYKRERRFIWPLLLLANMLFYGGITFAYTVILPILFKFLVEIVPIGVVLSPDIAEYLDFTLKLLLVFGILFEIPVVMAFLVLLEIVQRERFIKLRPYAIVSAFILGMLLAPPDVLSQTVVALPIWGLYELGIGLTWFFYQHLDPGE